ncbi:DUF72 domain-containing protein [Geomonas sp. Red32]|uniref:DUF72 domain-containing protein n=1 Tax=Geomonas sp. Red32 TaxID=2912856 RepID=UPI00202D0147|nr:DUF72 domain-containing protein [Geomonas sp. Red32]MCM0081465.1 DUF72 domain-containing protein [Geomonas sp. Red32]
MTTGAIRIGTCSWTESEGGEAGTFGVESPHDRLARYAERFDTVEVDSSYYALPAPSMIRAWLERTPPGFLFHVKAYGALTGHGIDPSRLPPQLKSLAVSPSLLPEAAMLANSSADRELVRISDPVALREVADAFCEVLQPLREAGKLGFIVFQYPPWFTCKSANRDYVLYCQDMMKAFPIAVEFRHGSWLTTPRAPGTLSFLRENRISYIACDEPQYGNLTTVPFLPDLTTKVAYLRLHGRDSEGWAGHALSREMYSYGENELRLFANHATRLARKARTVFVMFANCHGGHGLRNALTMKTISN